MYPFFLKFGGSIFFKHFVVIFITTDTVYLHVPVCNFKVLTQKPNTGCEDLKYTWDGMTR